MAADPQLSFAVRSGDIEVGILDGQIVVRRAAWWARMLRESCQPWLHAVR
jgi:hypothetical protein